MLKKLGIIILIMILIITPFFSLFNLKNSNAFSPRQSNFGQFASSAAPVVTLPKPSSVNLFIVVEVFDQDGGTINSVTDDKGNTYVQSVTDTNTYGAWIYIAKVTQAGTIGTVTANFAATQHNITISVQEMSEITSTTPSVTAVGHGTTANPISTGSVTPNVNDACFTSGGARTSTGGTTGTTAIFALPNAVNLIDSGFSFLTESKITTTTALAFVSYNDIPQASATTAKTSIELATNNNVATLVLWEIVLACFPQSQVTTTTTTTSNQSIGIGVDEISIYGLLAVSLLGFGIYAFRRKLR